MAKPGQNVNHQFNARKNSIASKVTAGDPDILELLGMTHEQAKKALARWFRDRDIEQVLMERWYREEVHTPSPYVRPDYEGEE